MKPMAQKCLTFIKKESILCIAGMLAVLSACIIPPSAAYLDYLDLRVLALLFCLMLVVAGLQSIGTFSSLGQRLLSGTKSLRQLALVLVSLCFFTSMFITNDVALITFVPFSVLMLTMAKAEDYLIPVIVLQTIAANLGSMLTPIGNPQNLYLYSAFSLGMGQFLLYMLPLSLAALLLLFASIRLLPRQSLAAVSQNKESKLPVKRLLIYLSLFLICLGCVIRLLPWPVMLALLIIACLVIDRQLFARVDYMLLLTFVFFFIFIGNMERIPAVASLLERLIHGRELWLGVLLSQCISNVPAAILLSGFTDQVRPLLYGINIGGLGTLIASLASVISYRAYCKTEGAQKGRYLKTFTLYSLFFLVPLLLLAQVLLYGFQ